MVRGFDGRCYWLILFPDGDGIAARQGSQLDVTENAETMNRILPVTAIPAKFIKTIEEAQGELHQRGWSIGHTAIGSVHIVPCQNQ